MRVGTIVVLVLIFSVLGFSQGTQNVYVLNTLGKTLSKVDLATGVVQKNAVTAGLYTNQVVIRQQRAFIVNSGDNAIQIVDLNTLSTVDTINVGAGTNPYYMDFINDSIAVVSLLFTNEIAVVNVNSGTVITKVSLIGNGPEGIKFAGGKVYVAMSGYNGQGYDPGVVNVVDPVNWSVVDTIGVSVNPQFIDADDNGGFVFVACTGNYVDVGGAMVVIDTYTDDVVFTLPFEAAITTLDYSNKRVYMATYGYGVYIYDSEGDSLLTTVLDGGPGVLVDTDGYIYVTDFNNDSLYVYDSTLQRSAAFEVGDGPISIAVDDPALTAITVAEGPTVPGAFQLYQNYPNPFNPATTIRFDLNTTATVTLDILNILGQTVTTLVQGELVAGTHEVVWNGRDHQGNRVPSGIYFYRLMVNGQQQIRKMQLIQ